MALAAALGLVAGCEQKASDAPTVAGQQLGQVPLITDPDAGIALLPGDPNFALQAGGNVVSFVPATAFFSAADPNDNYTTIYLLGSETTCAQWMQWGPAAVPAAMVMQLRLAGSPAAGTIKLVPDAEPAGDLNAGEGVATFTGSNVSLLAGGQGSVTVANADANAMVLGDITLTWPGLAPFALGRITAAACRTAAPVAAPLPEANDGTDGKDAVAVPPTVPKPAGSFAAAYVRPPLAATATARAQPPLIVLIDQAITCAQLRDPASNKGANANYIFIVPDKEAATTFAVTSSTTKQASPAGGAPGAAVRRSSVRGAPQATGGSVTLTSVSGAYAGTVSAIFNDGSELVNLPFAADVCP